MPDPMQTDKNRVKRQSDSARQSVCSYPDLFYTERYSEF